MAKAQPKKSKRPLEWGDLYLDHSDNTIKKWFNPHKAQLAILRSKARFLLALGGVNGGKTSLAMLWLALQIQQNNFEGQYLVVAPTSADYEKATYPAWIKVINGIEAFSGHLTRSGNKHTYQLDCGATVFFCSAESSLVGAKPKAVVLDEGGKVELEVYRELCNRLIDSGGKLLIATTPYQDSADWIRTEIIAAADAGNKLYHYEKYKTVDNPKMANDPVLLAGVMEQKRVMPAWEYAMKYEGEFTRPPALVYELHYTDLDGKEKAVFVDSPDQLPWAEAYYGSVDFGGADPTVLLLGMLDCLGVLWIIGEHYKPNESTLSTIKQIEKIDRGIKEAKHDHIRAWWADHRKDIILSFRNDAAKFGLSAKVVPAYKGANSIQTGISKVRSRIGRGKLRILKDKCPCLYDEMLKYSYPMDGDEVVGVVPKGGQQDHALDALRYMVLGIDRRNALTIS